MTDRSDPEADITSGEAVRVRAGLTDLDRRWRERREVALAPPGPEILDAWGARAPTDAVMDYLTVLGSYRGFVPRLSAADLAELWVRTQLLHGDSATALQIALQSRTTAVPELRPGALVAVLARQSLRSEEAQTAAAALVRHLLDSDLSHDDAFRALSEPACREPLSAVIHDVAGWLDADERRLLGV